MTSAISPEMAGRDREQSYNSQIHIFEERIIVGGPLPLVSPFESDVVIIL